MGYDEGPWVFKGRYGARRSAEPRDACKVSPCMTLIWLSEARVIAASRRALFQLQLVKVEEVRWAPVAPRTLSKALRSRLLVCAGTTVRWFEPELSECLRRPGSTCRSRCRSSACSGAAASAVCSLRRAHAVSAHGLSVDLPILMTE